MECGGWEGGREGEHGCLCTGTYRTDATFAVAASDSSAAGASAVTSAAASTAAFFFAASNSFGDSSGCAASASAVKKSAADSADAPRHRLRLRRRPSSRHFYGRT